LSKNEIRLGGSKLTFGFKGADKILRSNSAEISLIPAATFTLLPGLGRIPQIEDPDAFNRALVAQLNAMK
jgi:pimeloyl-ACP methyl ester carboxylesterase